MENKDLMDVLQRIQRAKAYTESWHVNIKKWRKLYNGEHYSTPRSKTESRYTDPTYLNAVDLATGIMLGNQLVWRAKGWNSSLTEEKEASYVEKYLAGAWFVNSKREESHLLYEAFMNFNRDGGAVVYSVWDSEIADSSKRTQEFPDAGSETGIKKMKVFDELPLRVQVIDPLNIFFLPGGPKRWMCVGRGESKTVADVERTYNVQLEKYAHLSEEQKFMMRGEFVDYWQYSYNEDHKLVVQNMVLFQSEPLPGWELRDMEGYEDIPYTIQFFKPTDKDNPSMWHSLIHPLESSVAMMERSINRRQRQIDVYSSLPIITKTHPGRVVTVDPGLGKAINISTDEEVGFPQWPGNAPDVQYQIDFYHARIQQSGFSDVMYGSGPSQVAGYALSQLGDQNRIRLEQPIQHMELLLTSWAEKALKICSNFSKKAYIRVYGTMRGMDFMEWVNLDEAKFLMVRAEVRPNFPNEEVRKHAMGTQTKGTLSETTRMEKYFGIEQPDEEMERLETERAMAHPVFQMYSIIHELKERADAGDEVAAMTLQALQNQGAQGQQTPGAPNPEQLTGLQSPTGEATPQAQGGQPYGQSQVEQMAGMANASPTMEGAINNG